MKNVGEYMSDMFGTLLTPSFTFIITLYDQFLWLLLFFFF